jgi:hypothetical protein
MKIFCSHARESLKISRSTLQISYLITVEEITSQLRENTLPGSPDGLELIQKSEGGGGKPGYSLSVNPFLADTIPRGRPQWATAKPLVFQVQVIAKSI